MGAFSLPSSLAKDFLQSNSVIGFRIGQREFHNLTITMIKNTLLALGLFALSAGSALAVDLQNEDNTTHQVKVVEGTNIIVFAIKPNSVERAVCEAICSIELGGDVLGAVGETVVTIKGGKLQGQSQLCPKQVCTPKGCETDYYPAPRCPVQPIQESTNSQPAKGKAQR
jgi:hypothetical protein